MEKEAFKKAKQIDTMLSVFKAERLALQASCYDNYVIIGIRPDGTNMRLAGIDPDLMNIIKQWYDDKIQELESEFEEL